MDTPWIISVCVSIQNFWDTRIYMPLLKPIQKMPNSHLKMLKQQHFLYQRKNLYDLMPSRSFSGDPTSDDNSRFHPCWSSFLFPSHRTLYLLVWRWGEGVAEHKASWMVTYTLKNTTHSRVSKPPERLTYTQINIDQQPSIKDSWAGNICKSS